MMHTHIHIFGDSETSLWGLSGKERLLRALGNRNDLSLIDQLSQAPVDASVLLLRGDYLFDPRVLNELLSSDEEIVICASDSEDIAAVRMSNVNSDEIISEIFEHFEKSRFSTLPRLKAEDLVNAYDPRLLKYDPSVILAINNENKAHLESELFDGSYKGVTDFVTKWLWPIPARWSVKWCVRHDFSPNQVTIVSVVLAIGAGLAFWAGYLLTGLVMGWLMTFLDTVDGKLARVTVTSSKMGDILDHGLDLIHPPLWYLAWGMGISEMLTSSISLMSLFWIILIAYIGGRLCEGGFEWWLASFRLFLWKPWDSYNRLITARRNPNLVILSLSVLYDRPDIGLYLVVIWHVLSTLILMARLYVAHKHKKSKGQLTPWLNDIDPVNDRHLLAVRLFTRLSKTSSTNDS
jgi:phosphatidylglycerophosphate synthase